MAVPLRHEFAIVWLHLPRIKKAVNPYLCKMNRSFQQTIQIFLPGPQLETTPAVSRVESETGVLATSQSDQELPLHYMRKRRRERQVLESHPGGSSLHFSKKSKQNENDDVFTYLHPLQDYLHPGLDGMSFFQFGLRSQLKSR